MVRSISEIFRSYAVFDSEGRHVNGTDKMSNHNYGEAYSKLLPNTIHGNFWPICRQSVKLMMEVGVADGSSLLAWHEVFPNALCVGMDIHHSDKAHGDRIEFRIGDQRSQKDCENAAAGREFDFICEDATHNLGDTLTTLLYLWPSLRLNGLYVIEEFANIHSLKRNIRELFPFAEIIDTTGPTGGSEPLVALRKVWRIHDRA